SRADLTEAYDNSLLGWSRALSLRDHDTDEHSKRVVDLTVALAADMGSKPRHTESIRAFNPGK
ncbi:MAG: hypothetical protein MUP11_01280, partial [Anaerolineales bacterium]|nr:hypothetical protein [Anaerolineales bacterium]